MGNLLQKCISFFKDFIEAAEKVKEDVEGKGTKVHEKLGELFWNAWNAAGLPGTEEKIPSDKEIEVV